jgi:hypothetical protein
LEHHICKEIRTHSKNPLSLPPQTQTTHARAAGDNIMSQQLSNSEAILKIKAYSDQPPYPPSTLIIEPVTKLASSDAKKETTLAISFGSANLLT